MNKDQLVGKWDQVKGQIKEKWGKLTDNDITVIHGREEQLLGKIKERYGYGQEEAERQVTAFMKDCQCQCDGTKDSMKGDSKRLSSSCS